MRWSHNVSFCWYPGIHLPYPVPVVDVPGVPGMKDLVSFCILNGTIHIKQEYLPEYIEPRYCIHYYPTGIFANEFITTFGKLEDQEFCNPGEQFHHGIYQFRHKGYGFRDWHRIQLPQLAKTKAVKIEVVNIQCPKVKKGINTRYNAGKWEKELKSGWCATWSSVPHAVKLTQPYHFPPNGGKTA